MNARNRAYRSFTAALKASGFGEVAGNLVESPTNVRGFARESLVQAPVILSKALRGGCRGAQQPARMSAPPARKHGGMSESRS